MQPVAFPPGMHPLPPQSSSSLSHSMPAPRSSSSSTGNNTPGPCAAAGLPFGTWLPESRGPPAPRERPPASLAVPAGYTPLNDPSRMAFDLYIPPKNEIHQCTCCPHHIHQHDSSRPMYQHNKPMGWFEWFWRKCKYVWHTSKAIFFYIEPWVVRPLIAGLAYNFGIQIARILIQNFFPSFFPTTVYFPLRSNAKFYDLHSKKIQDSIDRTGSPTLSLPSSSLSSTTTTSSDPYFASLPQNNISPLTVSSTTTSPL